MPILKHQFNHVGLSVLLLLATPEILVFVDFVHEAGGLRLFKLLLFLSWWQSEKDVFKVLIKELYWYIRGANRCPSLDRTFFFFLAFFSHVILYSFNLYLCHFLFILFLLFLALRIFILFLIFIVIPFPAFFASAALLLFATSCFFGLLIDVLTENLIIDFGFGFLA